MARQPRVEMLDAHGSLTAVSLNGRLFLDNVPTRFYKVLAAVFSRCGHHLALVTLDKQVVVLTTDDSWQTYEQSALHHIPKRPTALAFSPSYSTVVVSDAFGDVYKLPIDDNLDLRQQAQTPDDSISILGHFSTITHVAVTTSHIVTCDRDSRIRISDYKHPFIIHAFALGHSDVVTNVLLRGQRVISASADATVRLWNLEGLCLSTLCLHLPQYHSLFADVFEDHDKDSPTSDLNKLVVTSLHFHPLSRDIGLFTVLGGRAVYKVHGLVKGHLHHLDRLVSCDEVICGMSVDSFERKVWVSLQGSRHVRWWKLIMQIHESTREERTDTVEIASDVGREWEHYSDVDAGRYDWLSKQRKKEMVNDWKGKKRRHVDI